MFELDLELKYRYELTLCKPNREEIQTITHVKGLTFHANFPTTDELSFTISKTIFHQGNIYPHPIWDEIRGDMLIKCDRFVGVTKIDTKYFLIIKPILKTEDGAEYKEILAYSQEYELNKKILREYNFLSRILYSEIDELDSDGFQLGVLNYIIGRLPSWSLGIVDAELIAPARYRSFSISEQTYLGFLINEVQSTFQCVFIFDTVNKEIDVRSINSIGQNRGLYISEENYISSINQEIDHDEIVTRLHVYGKDNLSINALNPTGTSFVEDFSYYINNNFMSDNLVNAINTYTNLIDAESETFQTLLEEIEILQNQSLIAYGELIDLEGDLKIILDSIDVAIQAEEDYSNLYAQKLAKEVEIEQKENEITGYNDDINTKNQEIGILRDALKKENNFTLSELQELDFFVREKSWSDSNYERVEDLWEDVPILFEKINQPPLVFDIEAIDFLQIVEFQLDWEKLRLGDIVNIHSSKLDFFIQVRLVQYIHSVDDNSLSLHFSNKNSIDDVEHYLNDLIGSAIIAGTTVDMSKYKWDLSEENDSKIQQIINSALDASVNQVLAGQDQNIIISERGIALSDTTDPEKQIRILNNLIVLTDNNWATAKVAISPDGVVADRLIGRIILGNLLYIEDNSGELKIEGNLITIRDNQQNIRVELGNYDSQNNKYGLRLTSPTSEQVILDEDGIIQTDTIQVTDNVDSNNNLVFRIYIDPEVKEVREVNLAFSLEPFRAYSTGASSGGGTSTTTSSGGGSSESTSSGGGDQYTGPPGVWNLSPNQYLLPDFMNMAGSHNHGINTGGYRIALTDYNANEVLGHTGFVESGDHAHSMHSVRHTHEISIPSHSHSFWAPSHSHGFSVPSHSHGINYGIYTANTATGVTVRIGATQVAGPYSSNQQGINLSSYITSPGWHTIELTSTRLGRINASLFLKTFMGV